MATAAQIYNFINEVQKEALGEQAITVKNTTDLVSLGDLVLSSTTDKEQFYQKLVDKIGATYCLYRVYVADNKQDIVKNALDFGIIIQRVQTFKIAKAKANGSWPSATKNNPFTYGEDPTDLVQQLFKAMGTWEIEPKVIYDYQLFTAFKSAAEMGSFINMIYQDLYNAMEYELEQCIKMTKATLIAQCFKGTNTNIRRNLLSEYNTLAGVTLTAAQALNNEGFLKYASQQINLVKKRFPKMSSLLNGAGADRFTPTENIKLDILMEVASAFDSYLYADTYHNDMVALPGYNEVQSWQGSGVTFDECAKINVTDSSGTITEKSNIIAVMYDELAAGVMIDRVRTISFVDAPNERTLVYHKADWGSFVDQTQNAVVFYME